jgi:hypothetical protein
MSCGKSITPPLLGKNRPSLSSFKAAVVLSASVTFLSLPGLDAFSRTTGMVAILFAAFSMAATVVAIFRHKADLERPISHIGIEGMMVISVRIFFIFRRFKKSQFFEGCRGELLFYLYHWSFWFIQS